MAIAYSAGWQEHAAINFGYPKTLLLDAAFGVLCLAVLPFVTPRRQEQRDVEPDPHDFALVLAAAAVDAPPADGPRRF